MTFNKVYRLVRKIPKGKVATYGQIAKRLGGPRNARVVGWALHLNRDPQVPCHRVVSQSGRLADNFAHGGWQVQRKLLRAEKVRFVKDRYVSLENQLHDFAS